jgi:hypothetical protein
MTPELTKSQVAQEQLDELNQTLEKEKVQLTPEIEKYVREHVRAVQDKLQAGQDVYENELEFIPIVKMWVKMPKEWREKYKSVEEMEESNEYNEAKKRRISLKQWLDLVHVTESAGREKEWIDEKFIFPGGGKIKVNEDLDLENCTGLTSLPEGLEIVGALILDGCTGLTSIPKDLKIGLGLHLVGCINLTSLPDELKIIHGGLYLEGCNGLKSLPEGLRVGYSLHLNGCTGLKSLPNELKVGGKLRLSENLHVQVKKDAERLKSEGKIRMGIRYIEN